MIKIKQRALGKLGLLDTSVLAGAELAFQKLAIQMKVG
jgi:hypothetical protein